MHVETLHLAVTDKFALHQLCMGTVSHTPSMNSSSSNFSYLITLVAI